MSNTYGFASCSFRVSPPEPKPVRLEDCENAYPYLHWLYRCINRMGDPTRLRSSYTWGLVQAAFLAQHLGLPRMSVIEFGCAGGNGLLALETAVDRLEIIFPELKIDIHGFDTGRGLPPSMDWRDLPNLWAEGNYPMDVEKLRARLKRTKLHLGNIEQTLGPFLASIPSPIGFVSFDMDLYSSTAAALRIFEAEPKWLLPRVQCYFDDLLGYTNGHHNGERLAITEFNAAHPQRQVSFQYGHRYYMPPQISQYNLAEKFFMAHILDHPDYNKWDGLIRKPKMDLSV